MLLAELNLGQHDNDADIAEIYTAALRLRELVGSLQKHVHSIQAAPQPQRLAQ